MFRRVRSPSSRLAHRHRQPDTVPFATELRDWTGGPSWRPVGGGDGVSG